MLAWVRRGKAIMHTYIRLVALRTGELHDTVFVLNFLSSVPVMSDMYAWNDLCGSRETKVKSQEFHKGRLRGWSREIEIKFHGADPRLTAWCLGYGGATRPGLV